MVIPKWDTSAGQQAPAFPAADSGVAETMPGVGAQPAGPAETAEPEVPGRPTPACAAPMDAAAMDAADQDGAGQDTAPAADGQPAAAGGADAAAFMTGISAAVRQLADASEQYHRRAEQREAVIDHQRDEVDRLRRGERRGLLRPLLVETCRLRNDLLRQAGELPAGFDAEQAALLLRSYAESVEITLENSGVRTFAPDTGDPFDPRMHRRVGGQAPEDPTLTGRIARVVRDGYLDVESSSPLAPAEVVVFANLAATASPAATATSTAHTADRSES